VRANSVHTSLDAIKEAGNCVFIPYEALIPYCERKVRHTTGQVFEFKWTMKILIEKELPFSALQQQDLDESNTVLIKQEFLQEEGSDEFSLMID